MRHRLKKPHLGKPADQRKAMLRSLVTSLFLHQEIKTTLVRAKALRQLSDKVVTFAKRGDLHAIRLASKMIYNVDYQVIEDNGKPRKQSLLNHIFNDLAPRFSGRSGGYTRVLRLPPRRGDATPMALVQLTFELDQTPKNNSQTSKAKLQEKEGLSEKPSKEEKILDEAVTEAAQDSPSTENSTVAQEENNAESKTNDESVSGEHDAESPEKQGS
ncbi:MAG: 50S ribosomal protein L17 [Cyanobacteria bacterium P01_H01_bin.74]